MRESSIAFGSSYEESALLPDAYWKDWLKDAIFAVVGNQPIGMLVLSFNQRSKTKHLAEIFSFYANKDYRGIGAGKKLMSAALEEVKSRGDVIKVRLSVNPEQKIAPRLYREEGFKIVGRLKKELLIDGRFSDEIIMEKFSLYQQTLGVD